jgi:acyl carrier protein
MTELEREIAASIVEALSLELPVDEFDPEAPLYGDHFGLDSIDMLEIAVVVSARYGSSCAPTMSQTAMSSPRFGLSPIMSPDTGPCSRSTSPGERVPEGGPESLELLPELAHRACGRRGPGLSIPGLLGTCRTASLARIADHAGSAAGALHVPAWSLGAMCGDRRHVRACGGHALQFASPSTIAVPALRCA